MQNVPLGLIKSREFSSITLDESQLAVYYASYRHLAKVASRDAFSAGKNGRNANPFSKLGTGMMIKFGGGLMFRVVASMCKRKGLDLDKAAHYGLNRKVPQAPSIPAIEA